MFSVPVSIINPTFTTMVSVLCFSPTGLWVILNALNLYTLIQTSVSQDTEAELVILDHLFVSHFQRYGSLHLGRPMVVEDLIFWSYPLDRSLRSLRRPYKCCCAFYRTSVSPRPRSGGRQKYWSTRGWVIGWTWKIDSKHFAHPSSNFKRAWMKSPKFGLYFWLEPAPDCCMIRSAAACHQRCQTVFLLRESPESLEQSAGVSSSNKLC